MISTILPIVALAGVAMAACPLTVEITGTTDHVAEVSITNTGPEALTVFKGNTVLHAHATKDLLVTDTSTLTSFTQMSIFLSIMANSMNRWHCTHILGCLCQLQAHRPFC